MLSHHAVRAVAIAAGGKAHVGSLTMGRQFSSGGGTRKGRRGTRVSATRVNESATESLEWAQPEVEAGWYGEEDESMSRMRIKFAKGVQTLVRNGHRSLEQEHYVQAASKVGAMPPGSSIRRYLSGFILNGHGNLLAAKGLTSEATPFLKSAFEHAVEEASQGLGDDRYSDIVSFASDLAINEAQNGRVKEAEKLIKRAMYWVGSSRVGPENALYTATLSNLGLIEGLSPGKQSSSLNSHERSVESDTKEDPFVSASATLNFSAALRVAGLLERGQELANRALDMSQKLVQGNDVVHDDDVAVAKSDKTNSPRQDLSAMTHAKQILCSAKLNQALFFIENASSGDDVMRAHHIAKEALDLGSFGSSVPCLLVLGLSAPTSASAFNFFSEALEKSTSQQVRDAVRLNVAALTEISVARGCEGSPKPESPESEVPASSEEFQARGLRAITVPPGRQIWVQEFPAYVSGFTLRNFTNQQEETRKST